MKNFIKAGLIAGFALLPLVAQAQTNAPMSGDCTANGTSSVTCTKLAGVPISLGGTFTLSGTNTLTITTLGNTTVTLPTTGTLASLANIATALPSATTTQLYGGTGAAGTAAAVSLGSGLSLSGSTLTATTNTTSALPTATTSQLYGGTGAAGTATPITLGSGLSLSSGTLSAAGGSSTIPVTSIPTSGTAQTLTFPSAGEAAVNITATGNLALTIAGGTAGSAQILLVNVTQDSTGSRAISFTNSNISWANGPPNFPQYAGKSLTFTLYAINGSTTYAGTY